MAGLDKAFLRVISALKAASVYNSAINRIKFPPHDPDYYRRCEDAAMKLLLRQFIIGQSLADVESDLAADPILNPWPPTHQSD